MCRVVVPIESSQRSGHSMEGTRLTVVKLGKEGAPAEDDEARLVIPRAGVCVGFGIRGWGCSRGDEGLELVTDWCQALGYREWKGWGCATGRQIC